MPKPYSSETPTSTLKTKVISFYLRGKLFELISAPDVFSHSKIDKGTKLLLNNMQIPDNASHVLDLGTGYGVIGIVIAKEFPQSNVIMVDINRRAISLAKSNRKKNDIKNAEIRWGDLYEPVKGDKFDVIVTNPPVSSGMKIIFQIIEEAPLYLKPHGSLQLVIRRGHNRVYEKLNNEFITVLEIGKKAGYHVYNASI